ncbi:retinol dehydrogenase 11-like [Hyposmocoma kahamanoa]|uniref:retinol dehydrogenase 11-like n=1 Tax=Hyposmocoma kahamanoa TaxID=1477025 RepID=UPI000E6DA305|nr:retinol dehydrogenase 11-like [Hyposmocoma kahamanoa]
MCETEANLKGKVAVVTGGSAGMGFEAAKNLAKRGAKVIIASRNETKLKAARDEIEEISGNNQIAYRMLDLGSLKSVRNFATDVMTSERRLDILVNTAGAIGLPDKLTEDGLNLIMQVNYFGTFLLTYLLLPLLKSSAPSRIINGSASAMYIGELEFDHWNDIGRYNLVTSVANCKLAVTLFSVELDRRVKGTGVTSNSFDPFIVRDTDLFNNIPSILRDISKTFVDILGLRREEVGKQIAYLAAAPELERVSGMHYKFCFKWINHWLVNDKDLTRRLWEASKEAVGITKEEDWEANVVK